MFLLIGLASVRRVVGQSYLLRTLHSLIACMSPAERSEVKVVVFLADLDPTYNDNTAAVLLQQCGQHVRSGLLTILRVLPEYYPPLVGLRRNFGDSVRSHPALLRDFTAINEWSQ